MDKKLIAVLAVLLMAAVPLAAFEYAEASGAETNDDDIMYLDDITGKTVDCWVTGTLQDKVITLTYNSTSSNRSPVVLAVSNSGELKDVTKVVTSNLTVPQYAALICRTYNSEYTSTFFYVTGTLTVNGTIAGDIYVDEKSVDPKITLDGATVNVYYEDNYSYYPTYITMNAATTLTIKDTTFEYFNKDPDTRIITYPGSVVTMENTDVEGYVEFSVYEKKDSAALGIKGVEADGFKLMLASESDGYIWTLSGSLFGNGTSMMNQSAIYFLPDSIETTTSFVWDNLFLYDLWIDFNYIDRIDSVTIKSTSSVIDYSSVMFFGTDDMQIFNKMKSGDKDVKMLLFSYQQRGGGGGQETTSTISVFIDETGSATYYNVTTVATQGVASIDDDHRINFAKVGESINLDEAVVTCESGYKFAGWYYLDENGQMCKVMNTSEFIPTESITLYAVAEKESPVIPDPPQPAEPKDYTVWFILIAAFMIVLLVAMCILGYYSIEKRATPAARKTTRKK